jgi:hypothetical protein
MADVDGAGAPAECESAIESECRSSDALGRGAEAESDPTMSFNPAAAEK